MRRVYLCFLIVLPVLLGFSSCQKDEEDMIVGKWQLREIKYEDDSVRSMDSIFYNFQKGTFSAIRLRKSGEYKTFFGSYSLKNSEISISLYLDEIEKNELYEDVLLKNADCQFVIDGISSSDMTLKYEDAWFNFRKY